jgi:hypothetical protein
LKDTGLDFDNLDLNVSFSEEHLQLLYEQNRAVCWKRLIITVLDGCTDVYFQIQALVSGVNYLVRFASITLSGF